MAKPRRAMVSYNGGSDTDAATRLQMVALNPLYIDGPRTNDAIYYRQNLPNARILQYLTISDVSVDSRLAYLLAQTAGESCLRHFYNDTTVNLVGIGNVRVKGFGGPFGTAATLAEARVPVYNGTRYLTNFGSADARTAHENYTKTQMLQVPFASGMFYDGIWHDNACYQTFNVDMVSLGIDTRLGGQPIWGQYVRAGTGAWAATGTYYYRIVPMVDATTEGAASPTIALTISSAAAQIVELDWGGTGNGTYRIYRNTSDTWGSGSLLRATVTGLQFIDNGAACTAGVPRGAGVVAENTAVTFKSREYNDWHWYQGMGLYLQDMKRYCDTRPATLGGRQTYMVANVANSPSIGTTQWKDNYVDFADSGVDANGPPAHALFMEFQFHPIRNDGVDIPLNIYTQAAACAAVGVDFWPTGYAYSIAYPTTGSPDGTTAGFTIPGTGNADTFTAFETMMGIVAQNAVYQDTTTVITGYPNSWVPAAQSDTNYGDWQYNTIGLWDVDLGTPTAAPTVLVSDTDPRGYAYSIYQRPYTQGLAIIRNRGGDSQRCDSTGVSKTITLPAGTWYRVTDLQGTVSGTPTTTLTLKNGEGALFKSGTPVVPDTTPPTTVSNLATSVPTSTSLTLTWTAPTDAVGLTGYDLRRSTSAINSGNFASATAVAPAPALGSHTGFVVNGLAPATLYHFAIKGRDAAGNWAAISNVPTGTTSALVDVTPPATISDLVVTTSASSISSFGLPVLNLAWTSPSDANGCVEYDIRISTTAISAGNFSTQDRLTGWYMYTPPTSIFSSVQAPRTAGQAESMSLTGIYSALISGGGTYAPDILPSTTYYVAIKSKDPTGNWSAISNLPSVTTGLGSDILAPDAVTTLSVAAATTSTVSLSRLSVLDNIYVLTVPTKARATGYDLRYSTSPITEGSWASCTQVAGENIPKQTAGQTETFVVTGLASSTTYYFACKVFDAAGNYSALSNVVTKKTADSAPDPGPFTTVPQTIIRGRTATIPPAPVVGGKPLIASFPQYGNLYWNDKWGKDNGTTPGRDNILRALANHKMVVLDERVTNPLTTATNDFGIEDAASRLKAMNPDILVGISCNAWSVNENGTSVYWPFRTMFYAAAQAGDWWLRFTNNAGGIVYSDGNSNVYRMIDITNPDCRQWFADNARRYFMMGGFDQYDFLFFDEMQNSLAAIPTQTGGASSAIALFNGSKTTRAIPASTTIRDALWDAASRAFCALMPDINLMPNGTVTPTPNMIGRMVQGVYPSTKPDNEWPIIQAHWRNTKRNNRLMYLHTEWGSAIPYWLQNVGLDLQAMIDMGCVRIVSDAPEYLAQGSWAAFETASKDIACMASIMDGVGQLEPKLSGHFKQPWQYFGYAPGVFGVPEEYVDGAGVEYPRIYTEQINGGGGTFGSGIYYRKFTKAIVAFNWQYDALGGGVALTWSLSGQSIAKNRGAVIWR